MDASSHTPFSWTSSTGPWTRSAQAPSARSSVPTTPCLASPALATTWPRATNTGGAELIDSVLDAGQKEAENWKASPSRVFTPSNFISRALQLS